MRRTQVRGQIISSSAQKCQGMVEMAMRLAIAIAIAICTPDQRIDSTPQTHARLPSSLRRRAPSFSQNSRSLGSSSSQLPAAHSCMSHQHQQRSVILPVRLPARRAVLACNRAGRRGQWRAARARQIQKQGPLLARRSALLVPARSRLAWNVVRDFAPARGGEFHQKIFPIGTRAGASGDINTWRDG